MNPKSLPSITILLTVKNNSYTIENCVNSLAKLNYPKKKYNIFVVDAFSNDGTWEKLVSLKKKIKLPKIILKRKKGNAPSAYNYAIKYIKSDFIAFIDGDCVADKDWLLELIKGIKKESKNVPGVAGYVLNPPKLQNKLQEIIGIELQERYKKFPRKLIRAPTMNLLVKTNLVKKIKFDEKLDVGYDTDFGYRLTKKYGKILYRKEAKIFHYHRSSWKSFFKQQFNYAKFIPFIYLKHINKIKGDHISTPTMVIQLILGLISLLSLFITFLYSHFILVFSIFYSVLWIFLIKETLKFPKKEIKYMFYYLVFLNIRLVAWIFGLMFGLLNLFKNFFVKHKLL